VTSPLPHAEPPGQTGSSTTAFDGVLRAFSVITMVMTVPQVVSVWSDERGSSGVSLLSWGTYLVSAWPVAFLRRAQAQPHAVAALRRVDRPGRRDRDRAPRAALSAPLVPTP